ncbi:TBCK protein kinase [Balamuthia mandrillaris]
MKDGAEAVASAPSQLCFGLKSFVVPLKPTLPHSASLREKHDVEAIPSPLRNTLHRFQALPQSLLDHRHLCRYIDVKKGKHERIYLVAEHYTHSLRKEMDQHFKKTGSGMSEQRVARYAFQILQGLSQLHEYGITHRNLSPSNIMLDDEGNVKLADYALYHITRPHANWATRPAMYCKADVSFAIGSPAYMAPEVIALGPRVFSNNRFLKAAGAAMSTTPSHTSADIWSVGMIVLEMVVGRPLWPDLSRQKNTMGLMLEVLKLCGHDLHESIEQEQQPEVNGSSENGMAHQLSVESATSGLGTLQRTQLHARHKIRKEEWLEQLDGYHSLSNSFKEIIAMCMECDPGKRGTAELILAHPYFGEHHAEHITKRKWVVKPFLRCSLLRIKTENGSSDVKGGSDSEERQKDKKKEVVPAEPLKPATHISTDPLKGKPLSEVYHFWELAGGSIEKEFAKDLKLLPPILRLPTLIRVNDDHHTLPSDGAVATNSLTTGCLSLGVGVNENDPSHLYKEEIIPISLNSLRRRLILSSERSKQSKRRKEEGDELSLTESGGWMNYALDDMEEEDMSGAEFQNLSLAEKEKNIDYQRYRVKLFRTLLKSPRPVSASREIIKEAAKDIPPVLRGEIWAVILEVEEEKVEKIYDSYDKDSEGPADRQIELDVPRCHQYHPLLSSPEGHRKLRRVLKAWVAANKDLVYWQGLDSLLAPFLVLNFQNEAMAFCCLQNLTSKYLHDFFLPDNTIPLQQHLATFRQVLAYHHPDLAAHLHRINLHPELYAIPWFLTLFTHILPLDKLFHVWDTLLLHSSSLTHFLAVALLEHLHEKLLALDFNACILLFGNLPPFDIPQWIERALFLYNDTPHSIYGRSPPKYPHEKRWWEEPLPLAELHDQLAPRLSLNDLVSLQEPPLVVDVQPTQKYMRRHYPDSVHVNRRAQPLDIPILVQNRGRDIVIVAGKGKHGFLFANKMIYANFPRVSVLAGGIDVLQADASALLESSPPPSGSDQL